MRPCQPDTRTVLDIIVDLLEMLGRTAAYLQHKVKFTGKIIAGDDGGMLINLVHEVFVITGMLHADFHHNSDVVSQFMIIGNDSICFDDTALFKFSYSLYYGRNGKVNCLADIRRAFSRIHFEFIDNLSIEFIHFLLRINIQFYRKDGIIITHFRKNDEGNFDSLLHSSGM